METKQKLQLKRNWFLNFIQKKKGTKRPKIKDDSAEDSEQVSSDCERNYDANLNKD